MKSPLLVILPAHCTDPEAALKKTLEHFRLNDDLPYSMQKHHWDYWYYPESWIAQPGIAESFPSLPAELAGNIGLVERLSRSDYWTGVLTPDLQWRDLQDHGWRLTHDPSPENQAAAAAWAKEYASILDRYPGHLAAGVIVHM